MGTRTGVVGFGASRREEIERAGGSRVGAVLLLSLTFLVASASSAWGVNEFATGRRTLSSADLDGVRGNQGIRTNPATVNGVSYVHPVQMDVGSAGSSFVAIGTYNGQGTSGGSTNCPNDYDSKWSGYYDGIINGVYFCQKFADDQWSVGDSPGFRIERDCPIPPTGLGWGLYFAGTQRGCISSGAVGATRAVAGLEVVSSNGTDRNVDVKYTSLNVSFKDSSTWVAFDNNESRQDPSYTFTRVSSTAFNTFLAPLD